MIVLAFDTAMAACSAAVVRVAGEGRETLAEHHEDRVKGHAEVLLPMIADVMRKARVGFSEIDRIAVTTGPGTFTGVRIGVATARGMAAASGLPVVGVTTLEAVAAGAAGMIADPGRAIASLFDARRGEVYVQCFAADLRALTEPQVLPCEETWEAVAVHDPIAVGTGAGLAPGAQRAPIRVPDQPTAAIVAARGALCAVPREAVVPLYLRPPDAKLPR